MYQTETHASAGAPRTRAGELGAPGAGAWRIAAGGCSGAFATWGTWRLEEVGEEEVGDLLLVLWPVGSVLDGAGVVVPDGAVDEEDGEVGAVEVGDGALEAAEEAPGEGHEPVAGVVDLASHAPPARGEEARATLGLYVLEVRDLGSGSENSCCGAVAVRTTLTSSTFFARPIGLAQEVYYSVF